MSEREKMIEIVTNALSEYCSKPISEGTEPQDFVTDRLLANGVTCLSCKVGQTVYILVEEKEEFGGPYIREESVVEVSTNGRIWTNFDIEYDSADIGTMLFFSLQDAERKLKYSSDSCFVEAIEHFKYGIEHDIYNNKVRGYAVSAVQALERLIAKEPHKGQVAPAGYINIADCPYCGEDVQEYQRHCPNCGQKIDWSDTK